MNRLIAREFLLTLALIAALLPIISLMLWLRQWWRMARVRQPKVIHGENA